jgi:cell division protein FtsB
MKVSKHKFSLDAFLKSPLALGLSFVLFLIVLYSVISMIPKQKRAQEAKVYAENELRDLQETKTSLEEEIGLLSSDFGREKALREKFGVVKEGEEIIVLVDNEKGIDETDRGGVFGWIKGLFQRD